MRVFLLFAALSCVSLALAQEAKPAATPASPKHSKGEVTIQGCVSRLSGDYVLMKQDPAVTYELQATGKIRFRHYLGQRVEVTGEQGPTMSTSSDALTKTGSASPVTITVRSIKTLSQECSVR
jgi:cellobiose phosphorylase